MARRTIKRFKSRAKAQGFVAGVEYTNDSALEARLLPKKRGRDYEVEIYDEDYDGEED